MKKNFFVWLVAALLALSFTSFAADATAKKPKLRHIVAFKFKEGTSAADIKKVEDAFLGLEKKITQIKSIEWGKNISKENKDKGFTHCWTVSFTSEKKRDEYIAHPDHKEFGKLIGPFVADVFVFDYWTKD